MMTTRQAAQLIHDALAAAISNDINRAVELVTQLVTDSDATRMYSVCTAFAEAGHRALRYTFGDKAPRPENGDFWIVEQLEEGTLDAAPAQAFASRFLIAHCNGDQASTTAQYETALIAGPEVFVGGVMRLVADVAGLARTAIKELEARES
ncbi:hypothetical protein ABZ682_22685 [Streptomyces griseoviridis]|uniref:hypothetical protein n=1 Tax=Streptomyces griseoviridis TaxID=45398 RepID=UPI0033DFB3E1